MKMLRVRRPVWRAALLALAMVALALTVPAQASAAPALAEPTQAEIEAGLATFVASLPAPISAGVKPAATALPLAGAGRSSQLVITCVGRSTIRILGVQNFNYVIAESTSECPVAVDWIGAQTWLYQWNPGINDWAQVASGLPDGHPGTSAKSTTFEYACSIDATIYAALGYHYARLGQSSAVAYTFYPGASTCSLRP